MNLRFAEYIIPYGIKRSIVGADIPRRGVGPQKALEKWSGYVLWKKPHDMDFFMDHEQPTRKRMRLEGFDYSKNGAYYITICTEHKEKLLCDIRPIEKDGLPQVTMSPMGKIVEETIKKIPGIDQYVVMPNHIHLIIFHDGKQSISKIIQFFKVNTTRKIGRSIWQRSFYDHIIRDETDYQIKWKYIDDNIAKWADDDYY